MAIKVLTGNYAAAYGAKLARVEVISAYPITPQTPVVEKLAEFVEEGELNAKFIHVESEHSAMAAAIGAAAAGARAFTATSSQGLFYMYEMVWWAAGARLPVVMGIVTRAPSPPWTIWGDHCDFLSIRDTGWILMFASSAQEVLDTIIQAYKIAESEEVMLPVAVGWDAFITSHTAEPVDVPDQDLVDEFLPPKKPAAHTLDVDNPFSLGQIAFPDKYMEFKWLAAEAMERAKEKIVEVDREYAEIFGRSYGGLLEEYRCDDADAVAIVMGGIAGDAMDAVDELRERGYRVGVCRIRVVRPFPLEELRRICTRARAIAVLDKNISQGSGGIVATELKSALYDTKRRPLVLDFIVGLGGRDVKRRDVERILMHTYSVLEGEREAKEAEWIGLRPEEVLIYD